MNLKQLCNMEEVLEDAFNSIKHKNRPEEKALEQALKIIDGIVWNWGNYLYADNKRKEIKDLEYMIKKAYRYGNSPAKQKIAQAYLIMQDSKNEGTIEFLEEFSSCCKSENTNE